MYILIHWVNNIIINFLGGAFLCQKIRTVRIAKKIITEIMKIIIIKMKELIIIVDKHIKEVK